MSKALARADWVSVLWLPVYFEPSRFTTDDWTAMIASAQMRAAVTGSYRAAPGSR